MTINEQEAGAASSPPSFKEEEESFKPIDLLLDPNNKAQLDIMDDTKTRNVIETEEGEEIELDDEFVEYLLKCGIIQKRQEGTTAESSDNTASFKESAIYKEMNAYLQEEKANRGKPKPDQEPSNISRLVDLLRTL